MYNSSSEPQRSLREANSMHESTIKKVPFHTLVIIALLGISSLAIYYFHAVLDIHEVFTHFFYIPIILASLWWRYKGLYVALLFAFVLVTSHFLISDVEGIPYDLLRSFFFISAGFVIDTLARRIALTQDALERSREQYENLYESAPDIYLAIAPDGTITNVNTSGAGYLGYAKDRLIGESIWTFIHEAEITGTQNRIREIFEQKVLKSELESLHVRNDGSVLWLHCRTQLLLDEEQTPVQLLMMCRDLTERKRMEDALREAEAEYSTLVEQARDGVFLVQDETVEFANRALADMRDYAAEELIGRPFSELLSPEVRQSALETHIRRLKGEKVPDIYDSSILRKDGTTLEVEISENLIQYEGKPAILGCVRDITERKQLEAERLRAGKLESLALLAGGIAHDFNNILTGILGGISLAKMYVKPDDKIYARLEDVERASVQAKDLTQQLLTISKGGVPIKGIALIAKTIRDACRLALRGSRASCRFAVPDELWPVEVDEGQIRQVISNIIINADQAMPQGGTITVRAENVGVAPGELPLRAGDYVKVSITDQGIGIPEEDLGKVFDPYFTTKPTGTGLGLATAYSIIENHDGHIGVDSELGVGTSVYFYLPASPQAVAPKALPRAGVIPGKGRILLMDDEDVVRRATGEILSHIGYETEYAKDGDGAIKLYQEAGDSGRPFDAVILDMTVPGGKGGKEAIKDILEINPGAKAIISTGYANDPIMITFKEYGFKGAIAKPYDTVQLSGMLHEVITKKEL